MRLTVLGSAASYPDAGRACAGHLVQAGDTSVLFDCGNGVLSNLGKLIDPTHLAGVFVTHSHIDHFADLYALQAALRYAPTGPMPPLPLHLPRGLFPRMQAVLGDRGAEELASAFEVHELVADEPVVIRALRVTPRRVEHVGEAFALVAEAGGKRLCYTSDTRPGAAVRAAADGADVLLAEATLPPAFEGRAPHLTPAQAATLAAEVGASALVLTHLWPTVDRAEARATCEAIFSGRVMVADELDSIDLD